jgi:hypothetical protein
MVGLRLVASIVVYAEVVILLADYENPRSLTKVKSSRGS